MVPPKSTRREYIEWGNLSIVGSDCLVFSGT